TPAGRRRDLCFDTCFALVPPGRRAGTASASPVRVGTLTGGDCGRCGHPLHNLLDVDLSDRRFAFLKVRATRLPVPACLSCFDWTYATFDRAGRAAWSPRTPEPEFEAEEYVPLAAGNLVLGPQARTPLEPTLGSPSSAVGGHPFWINDAEFPPCPGCRRPMPLVGHVDLGAVGADGIGYAYACGACRTTAANFRCT
ncbi:MAG TPA: hypothetical protein VF796_22365, partial [Humisphaera sp.]